METKIKRIWDSYTESTRTVDFSGKEINKSSYGNKNSNYCWNIDHILSNDNNIYENLQPTHIKTNEQKDNSSTGKIVHKYDNYDVITIFEVRKQAKHTGIIYIKKQYLDDEINIENIYFKDEIGYFEDENYGFTRFAQLNVSKSIEAGALIFIQGNNPRLWQRLR